MGQHTLESIQAHADTIEKAARDLNLAIIDANKMGLTVQVRVLEFNEISAFGPRPQIEVEVMMSLKGSIR